MITMMSCTQHTVYKTRTEYVYPPKEWIQPCKAVDVQEGAKTSEELLKLLSIAYVETLKNISACNIKTNEALNYVEKISTKNK